MSKKNEKKNSNKIAPNGIFSTRHNNENQKSYLLAENSFLASKINLLDKLESFPRFATKRSLARFLVKEKLFNEILHTGGVIVECGVFNGAGLFTWAQLTNIYEPVNYTRKIIGFDTFSGFPSVSQDDNSGVQHSKVGDLTGSSIEELKISLEKYNSERHLSHIPNVQLIQGNFLETAQEYLDKNPHTIISLLYLDFDLYEPTKFALEKFLPRMPKGSIVAFDELNCDSFPGETKAMNEVLGISKYTLKRFPIDPWISYIQL